MGKKKIISFTSSGMGDIWEIVTKMIDEIWDSVKDGKNLLKKLKTY